MAVSYLEISYPNFVLGAIIDPEEANQNNFDLQTKINDTITAHNLLETKANNLETKKADVVYVDGKISTLNTTITTNDGKLTTHKSSSDHDARYYIKSEIDNKIIPLATKAELSAKADKSNTYTREELSPWLRGGDTNIREDVFVIIDPNQGDGTFLYSYGGNTIVGNLGDNGEQHFALRSGYYEPGNNRVEAMVNDTLRRSVASGGLVEIDNYTVALTSPEGSGAEITFKYYERIGMTAEYNIKLGTTKPPFNQGKNMWFEVI